MDGAGSGANLSAVLKRGDIAGKPGQALLLLHSLPGLKADACCCWSCGKGELRPPVPQRWLPAAHGVLKNPQWQ